MSSLGEKAGSLLGSVAERSEALSGGDLSQIVRVVLTDGRRVVAKNGPNPSTEAEMLAAMAATGITVPQVLASNDEVLVMTEVACDASSACDADVGAALLTLHRDGGRDRRERRYGWHRDFAFGPVAIENAVTQDWPTFWSERRLLVHLPHLAPSLARRVETVAGDLSGRLPIHPPASLLHGDLWSGNILGRDGRLAAFVDPACYYGHGEVDIAMLSLFGRPGAQFFDAYGKLEPGYEDRLAIYQLWPALVHLRLFGAAYRGMVDALLSRLGA